MPGISNKRQGSQFEAILYHACIRSGIAIVRIEDGCMRTGTFKRFKLIPKKQPCDFIMAHQGRSAAIDSKTIGQGKTFAYASINASQVHSMNFLAEQGMIAGYLCWFRQIDKLVFFTTKQLLACHPGTSLSIDEGLDLNTIEDPKLINLFRNA